MSTSANSLLTAINATTLPIQLCYLKSIVFLLSTPLSVVESYAFHFSYSDGNPQMSVQGLTTKQDVMSSTIALLVNLSSLVHKLDPLPKNILLSMKLLYYESTPKLYQPPGFVHSNDTPTLFGNRIGSLETGFHAVGLQLSSTLDPSTQDIICDLQGIDRRASDHVSDQCFSDASVDLMDLEASQGTLKLFSSDISLLSSIQDSQGSRDSLQGSLQTSLQASQDSLQNSFQEKASSPLIPSSPIRFQNQETLELEDQSLNLQKSPQPITQENAITLSQHDLKCICDSYYSDPEMLLCSKCNSASHIPCYGYNSPFDPRIPSKFQCNNCSSSPSFQLIALKRRCLASLYKDYLNGIKNSLVFKDLFGIGNMTCKVLFEWLKKDGFIEVDGHWRKGYKVVVNQDVKEKVLYWFSDNCLDQV